MTRGERVSAGVFALALLWALWMLAGAVTRLADAYDTAHEDDEPPPLWCQQEA